MHSAYRRSIYKVLKKRRSGFDDISHVKHQCLKYFNGDCPECLRTYSKPMLLYCANVQRDESPMIISSRIDY
ncbi:hypothetical protein GJ496_011473 [Pomphorhynchus laevis]|nr:hypothetical protein GJ496_011473 [Pomphorhynchus laevis]